MGGFLHIWVAFYSQKKMVLFSKVGSKSIGLFHEQATTVGLGIWVGKQNHLLFPVSHAPFFQGGNYTIFWAKSWQFCGTPQIKPSLSTFLKKRTNRAKRTVSHLQKMQFRVEQSPSQKFHLIFIDHVKNDKKSTKLDAISND